MRTFLISFLAAATAIAADNLPRVDLHAHTEDHDNPAGSLKPADVVALGQKMNVTFGVLAEGGCGGDVHDGASLRAFLDSFEGLPVYRGLQVYGFDWPRCLPKDQLQRLDYLAADALVFPDRNGKDVWLWLPEVHFDDPQDFMNRYVDYTVRVLSQPVQVWANPTYLPERLQAQADALWTPERMHRVIDAAVKHGIAIELNSHFQIPNARFIRMAKAAGAKFSFGSNYHAHGIGDIDYGLRMARECGLTKADIFLPKRAIR